MVCGAEAEGQLVVWLAGGAGGARVAGQAGVGAQREDAGVVLRTVGVDLAPPGRPGHNWQASVNVSIEIQATNDWVKLFYIDVP